MTTYYTKALLIFGTLLYANALRAQQSFTLLWEPQIAVNYEVRSGYSHNFSIAQRNILYRQDLLFWVRQIDLAHFSDFQLADNQDLAFGLQYRFGNTFAKGAENEVRFTQQYSITHRERAIRLGHRVRAEQRIRSSGTVHRFRYRFALDAPLQGEVLNPGETYLVSSLESLLSVGKDRKPEYDQRISLNLGWWLQEGLKVEAGLQYRWEDYTQETENSLFLTTNLILSL